MFFCCGASSKPSEVKGKEKEGSNIKELAFKKDIFLNLDPQINLSLNQDSNRWEDVRGSN